MNPEVNRSNNGVDAHNTRNGDGRSLGELVNDFTNQMSTLVQLEVALAKAEMAQKGSEVGKAIGFLVAGGAIAYAGFLAIIAAAILLLGLVISPWLSALIVGAVVAIVGLLLVLKGSNDLKKQELAPRQTMETLKEDQEWIKQQMS